MRVERIVPVRILEIQAGHAPEPQKRRYADCNACILRIANGYPNQQIMGYLQHVAHNLSL